MILDLPATSSSAINRTMVDLREKGGANAQGRVLTLVIVTDAEGGEDSIAAANAASFEHPCRVLVVNRGASSDLGEVQTAPTNGEARLDAQIRVGGDAGASEVIVLNLFGELADHGADVVLPLLLPDAPVVAWWPGQAPAVPAEDPIGRLAQRRITDAAESPDGAAQLARRWPGYRAGDTDLAWTRVTLWRGLLAAALDQPPHEEVTAASVSGSTDSPSVDLLAAWLELQLGCPVQRRTSTGGGAGLQEAVLERPASRIMLSRPEGDTATLSVTDEPDRRVSLPRRNLRDCLAEELRRLEPDDIFAEVLSTVAGNAGGQLQEVS